MHFLTFITDNAIYDGCIYLHMNTESVCVLNTVENRTRLPSNLGHTLQHLLPHHTMWELSLFICIGGT